MVLAARAVEFGAVQQDKRQFSWRELAPRINLWEHGLIPVELVLKDGADGAETGQSQTHPKAFPGDANRYG